MKAHAQPRSSERVAAACLLLVAAALLLVRSLHGAGFWGDEPYGLSTALRFHLGDRPFVDSWDTNFSSAILALPFVRLYLAATGSTEGILLAYRAVFVGLTALTAVVAVRVLKNVLSWWLAVAVGVLLMLYVPYLSTFVGYGGDVLWHMLAALVAVSLVTHPRRGVVNALPGVLCGMGILGNPSTVVVIPFFALALWLAHGRTVGSLPRSAVGWYLAGAGAVGLLFLATVRLLSGPDMLTAIRHVTSPDDHDFGLPAQFRRLREGRWVLAIPLCAGAVGGLARRLTPAAWARWATFATLLGCVSLGLLAVATGRIPLLIAPQSMAFAAGAGLMVMHWLSEKTRVAGWQLVLVLPAVGAGLGWFLGSNGGVGTGVLAAPLIFAAALAWWPQAGMEPAAQAAFARRSAAVALALSIVATASFGMLYTPEGSTLAMTARIERGPFRGIRTTPQDAMLHGRFSTAIESLPRLSGRVVFMERFPEGYLIAGMRPGTYSTWATKATGPRLNEYLSQTGNQPRRVVLTRFSAEVGGGFPPTVSLSGFPQDYTRVYSDENVRVFDLVDR